MFETEAGFAETKMLINCNGDYSKKQDYKKGWQDGATFGYNKAKEEMQAQWEGFDSAKNKMEKRIEELEEKISILLSCKNCPENKGGLLCQKEYEDKCLAQKIQYIKELEKENAELKDKLKNLESVAKVRLANWQKYEQENAELKTQAKKIILKLYNVGRDVLMCRADEAAYDNLSTAINDRSIEQFLQENNNEQSRT